MLVDVQWFGVEKHFVWSTVVQTVVNICIGEFQHKSDSFLQHSINRTSSGLTLIKDILTDLQGSAQYT